MPTLPSTLRVPFRAQKRPFVPPPTATRPTASGTAAASSSKSHGRKVRFQYYFTEYKMGKLAKQYHRIKLFMYTQARPLPWPLCNRAPLWVACFLYPKCTYLLKGVKWNSSTCYTWVMGPRHPDLSFTFVLRFRIALFSVLIYCKSYLSRYWCTHLETGAHIFGTRVVYISA
jgi:hypothetical protein